MGLDQNLSRTVFRLRKLPNHVRDKDTAASLVATALSFDVNNIAIFSLANTSDIWENPPSRVATLQLSSLPDRLLHAQGDNEWQIPLPGGNPDDFLFLDIHFKGLTALNDVDPSSEHCSDCIAISGLASHPFGSWQPSGKDKSFMWIRDSIPRSVPGVRTVVYGYDSQLLESDSFQTISDIAQAFILHLQSAGYNLPSSKPIVFLAHSLGGIVLKEAIVQMADREKSVTQILDNILGAIMFGVPSLGMEQTHLISVVEGRPNEQLVQDLARDGGANYVRRLNTRFKGLTFLRTARLIWAYETRESPTLIQRQDGTWERSGPPVVLVNRESATCNNYHKNRSVTIPINSDHSSMVKFSRGDSDLSIVIDTIASLCCADRSQFKTISFSLGAPSQDANLNHGPAMLGGLEKSEIILQELGNTLTSLSRLHGSIYLPDLDFRISQIDTPFQDTYHWIFNLPVFSNWLQEGSGLFWIRGKPGSGKSTLMKFICQSDETLDLIHNWTAGSIEIQASFFFHYRGSAVQKSLEGVLRSLVTQLIKPFVEMYEQQHLATWVEFQQLRAKKRRARDQINSIKRSIHEIKYATDELLGPKGNVQSPEKESGQAPRTLIGLPMTSEEMAQEREQKLEPLLCELGQAETELWGIQQSISKLAGRFQPFCRSPITLFLQELITIFQDPKNRLIPKLEQLLRRLLDQDIVDMDLVLFFDALDEFNGHMDVISRFLKDLIRDRPKSLTRVKVCFSSRPWPELSVHFSKVLGFALQDHTRYDMEQYVSGSIIGWGMPSDAVLDLVPKIIERSDGVFLWVKLALGVLRGTFALNPHQVTLQALEKRLFELPEDLFQFYELIIERISKANRRRTFALIELVVRHNSDYGSITATQIRDAVLISSCNSYTQAQVELRNSRLGANPYRRAYQRHDSSEESVRDDLTSWGGGLIEIVPDKNNVDRPQLMHQTVLEFTMGLSFKRIVLGNTANIMYENGHSFHLKYWASTTPYWQARVYDEVVDAADLPQAGRSLLVPPKYWSDRIGGHETVMFNHATYHAQQSELTTGRSHFKFLDSLPWRSMPDLARGESSPNEEKLRRLLFFAIYCGLTLCVQDCIAAIRRLHPDLKPPDVSWRFFQSSDLVYLLMDPPLGQVHEHYFNIVRVLVETFGYHPATDDLENQDRLFVNLLLQLLRLEQGGKNVSDSPLLKVVNLVLENSRNQDVQITLEIPNPPFPRKVVFASHIAPTVLIPTLVSKGFDLNACDWNGETPLDTALLGQKFSVLRPGRPGAVSEIEDIRQRYEKSIALMKAGGRVTRASEREATHALIKFKLIGRHDISFLADGLISHFRSKQGSTGLLRRLLTADTEELERLRNEVQPAEKTKTKLSMDYGGTGSTPLIISTDESCQPKAKRKRFRVLPRLKKKHRMLSWLNYRTTIGRSDRVYWAEEE